MNAAGAFGNVLAHQADCVLARTTLSWAPGIGKVDFTVEPPFDLLVVSEFRAVVEGDGARREVAQSGNGCARNSLRQTQSPGRIEQAQEAATPLDQAQFAMRAYLTPHESVDLPVPDGQALLNLIWPGTNARPVRRQGPFAVRRN